MKYRLFSVLLLSALVLAGCVSREQADDKLARGCAAGAEALMKDGYKVKEIRSRKFETSSEFGEGYREVGLGIVTSDEWANVDKDITCVFEEHFGFLKSAHRGTLQVLKMDDQVYGMKDGQIVGAIEDHLKLNEAVEQEMGR